MSEKKKVGGNERVKRGIYCVDELRPVFGQVLREETLTY